MKTINVYTSTNEQAVVHNLNNLNTSFEKLKKRLQQNDLKAFNFICNKSIDNYRFDFYSEQYNIAIQIDGYSFAYDDIFNTEELKLFTIPYINTKLLKVTDYQVIIDTDQIVRYLKHKVSKNNAFELVS